MPDSVQSQCCSIAKTILTNASITGIAADRIKNGIYDQDPTQEFFQKLASEGYFIQIEPVKWGDFDVQSQLGDFEIPIKFYFAIPVKADFTFLAEQNVVALMRTALGTPSNWTALPSPLRISTSDVEVFLDNDAPAGLYRITLIFDHSS